MIGIIQFFLAASFVIWLVFLPGKGVYFAWPIAPWFSALFIGVGFILRTYLGFHIWHEKYWYRMRWLKWGNFMFLGVLFIATFWHLDEMNWKSNLGVAHIWVIAYIVEPLMLTLIEPHGAESKAAVPAEFSEGPISSWLKRMLAVVYVMGITGAAFLFINPAFADTRWPWSIDPFDARILAAWPAAVAVWAATMYFAKDWAEIKMGMQMLILYITSLFIAWAFMFPQFGPGRYNKITLGVATGLVAALLIFFYWRQEAARPKALKS